MPSLTISVSLKSSLRSSVAVSSYGVLGFVPSLVFDFKTNTYKTGGEATTFSSAITHAATTNATMTDGYGPNLVTNGDFANDSGWDKGTGWTISGGVATHSGGTDGNLNNTGYTVSAPSNKTFTITYTISGHTAGSVRVGLAGGNAQYLAHNGANGTYTGSVTNTGGNLYVRFQTAGFLGSIDNISVREAPALKWRPHNTLSYSEDLTNAIWVKQVSATVDANVAAAPDGSMTASRLTFGGAFSNLRQIIPAVTGVTATTKVWIKLESGNATLAFGISAAQFDTINVTSEWVEYSTTDTEVASNGKGFLLQDRNSSGFGSVLIWHPHSFRSDLGGMVNNPDASTGLESYVPTTTTPVYLSRRGHHIYNGSAWVNEGILHESEARTNLLTYSNDFTNSAWSKTNLTATANQATGPDGTVSATEIGITGTAGNSYSINSTASTTGTLSYFAKQNTERFFLIDRGVYGAGDWAIFDLSNGTVSKSPTHNNSTAHITPMGNGWYRCVLQSAQSATVNAFSISGSGTDMNTSTSGTVYLYGAQIEAGSTPSSYIPTGSASVTRAAETLTVPASNLPYDNTNMSIQIDGKMTYADSDNINEVQPYYWTLNGPNYIYARVSTSGTRSGQPTFLQRETTSGNDFVNGIPNAYTPDTNVPFNLASRHGSTFINGAHEGTLLTVNTTPTILPPLSATDLNLGYNSMGTIGQFRMWSDDLGDVGITEATLPSTEPSLSLTFDGSENSFIVLDWSE